MWLSAAGATLALAGAVNAASAVFYPNANLTDTDGNIIQAHGGAILQSNSAFYWFGQNNSADTDFDGFEGVSCYRSDDMSAWEYLGLALSPVSGTSISTDAVVERPKVLYNAKNDQYVMWFHLDSSDYGLAQVGVATSSAIEGPYSFVGGFSPLGHQSRDMTVWQDPDTAEGYLVFATDNNANLAIATLDDDYLNTTQVVSNFTGIYWEAPGIIKQDGTFYLLVSPQDGWTPTANVWMSATNMSGPWSDSAELAPSGAYTYLTQNAWDLTITGAETTTYVYFGDRWNGDVLSSSTYAFMPLVLNSSGLSIHNTGGWTLDVETGQWSDLDYTSITSCSGSCDSGEFGFVWNGTSGDKVLQVQYQYPGSKNAFVNLGVTVNGTAVEGNVLLESTIGSYTQQAPFPLSLDTGSTVKLTLLNGDDVTIEGVNVYALESGSSVSVS